MHLRVNRSVLLEVYSFAQNTLFLHVLKYGIPGSVLLRKRNHGKHLDMDIEPNNAKSSILYCQK